VNARLQQQPAPKIYAKLLKSHVSTVYRADRGMSQGRHLIVRDFDDVSHAA